MSYGIAHFALGPCYSAGVNLALKALQLGRLFSQLRPFQHNDRKLLANDGVYRYNGRQGRFAGDTLSRR